MPVSAATEAKLRAAMQRLLDGTPQRSDGALTKENLAREAAVSHATVHRAEMILQEWNSRAGQPPAPATRDVPGDEAITTLQAALRDANQKITTLNGRLDALAAVTANLYRENQALRAGLDRRTSSHHYLARKDVDEPARDDHESITIPSQAS